MKTRKFKKCLSILTQIEEVAAQHPVSPQHWIAGWDDGGLNYCREHGQWKVRYLRKKHRNREIMLDGGWALEEDTHQFCCVCGKQLDVLISDQGVEQELEHFEANGFDPRSPSDCYSLADCINHAGLDSEEFGKRFHALLQKAQTETASA